MLGTNPSYETNGNDEFEIIFLEGFDGTYLMWNSKEKKWKISFPTTFVNSNDKEENTNQTTPPKINGSTILFLRPNKGNASNLLCHLKIRWCLHCLQTMPCV